MKTKFFPVFLASGIWHLVSAILLLTAYNLPLTTAGDRRGSPLLWAQEIPVSKELAAAARIISTEEEIEIGREVAANVIAQFGLVSDEKLTEYVNLVGLTVAQFSPRQDLLYRFAILDSDIVNAFAAPGGYIFVSKGLLSLLADEAQLAGVLAHEIIHVAKRHVIKEIQKSKIAQAVIPSYVKASAGQAEWMSQVTDLAIATIWKGLSREDELESDRLGLELCRQAGYDAQAFSEVLQLLRARAKHKTSAKNLSFLLSSHPKLDDRLLLVSEKLKKLPAGGQRVRERFQKAVISDR